MSYQYTKAVVIGRFQPFHNGHLNLLHRAQELAESVVVLVGSPFKARNIKNPFTFEERSRMIEPHLREGDRVEAIRDGTEAEWEENVQRAVAATQSDKVVLVGYEKDSSSYYLRSFNWPLVQPSVEAQVLDATWVREMLYIYGADAVEPGGVVESALPAQTISEVLEFIDRGFLDPLIEEYVFIQKYKEQFASTPFPPVFVTTDAVVVCKGHVLLVERNGHPGKGLWALPGGFLNVNERVQEGALRELREETCINVPDQVLKGSIVATEFFDQPDRSLRGRTITHAFLIDLDDARSLPRVQGSDDADYAFWVPFSLLASNEEKFYEDHLFIIQRMLGHVQS